MVTKRPTTSGKRKDAAKGFFSLYANLLSVEARIAWDKIVSHQIGVTPWTNFKGKTQNTIQEKMKMSFNDCTKFHLMTVFSEDAVEQPKFYISNCLKRPTRVTVCAFFTCVEQLNSYVVLFREPNLCCAVAESLQQSASDSRDEARQTIRRGGTCECPVEDLSGQLAKPVQSDPRDDSSGFPEAPRCSQEH
jgi:hypothetical protein